MIFKIYDCDFGVKIAGQNYDFTHVTSVVIEDPETTKLVRGANASNKLGIAYKEGLKEAKKWTVTIQGMSIELKAALDLAYIDKSRLDCYAIDRKDGSSKMSKNSVLSNQPQQLNLDEGPDSMNVVLSFESFDLSEVHKT